MTLAVAAGGFTSRQIWVRFAVPAGSLATCVRAHLHEFGVQVDVHADPVPHVTLLTVALPLRVCTPTNSRRLLPAFTVCENERVVTFVLPPFPLVALSTATCAPMNDGAASSENASAVKNNDGQTRTAPPNRPGLAPLV